ncbi:MAG: nitronate monooxygenase [Bacteroidota bacterium]
MPTPSLPSFISEHTVLPMIAAPMFLVSGPALVTACCRAGVIGSFPCPNARPIGQLETWMQEITQDLEAAKEAQPEARIAPWAINMIMHKSYDRFEEELELVKKYQPKLVITALGSPEKVVEAVHDYGGLVFADVNSLSFAQKAAQMGVDGLILVASGAGGHTGHMASFAFVDAVREFWDGYLVLAGGISTGQGIRACQTLGADLAYMGTRFIPTHESMAVPEYQEMLIESTINDVILTDAVTGVKAYFMRQSLEKAGYDIHNLISKKVDFTNSSDDNKAWRDVWSAGQGVGMIKKTASVAEIVSQLRAEYRATLQQEKKGDAWSNL